MQVFNAISRSRFIIVRHLEYRVVAPLIIAKSLRRGNPPPLVTSRKIDRSDVAIQFNASILFLTSLVPHLRGDDKGERRRGLCIDAFNWIATSDLSIFLEVVDKEYEKLGSCLRRNDKIRRWESSLIPSIFW